jgi:hypothetical protein
MRSEVWRPAMRLVTAASGGAGQPPAGHYDPAARSSLHGLRRKCRRRKRGPRPKTATVERREASVLRYWTRGASQAPGLPRQWQTRRVPLHPGACRRSAHPLRRWETISRPGRAAPREGDVLSHGLFDIVSKGRTRCGAALAMRGFASRPIGPWRGNGPARTHTLEKQSRRGLPHRSAGTH